ncbi:hypothetical protein B4U37_03585 [Sutcliffiella horikoshii]|uniref:Uncharacterized protein n=1 Tax=Sutcliffiella horikoshii TaxID=79883 RepID=A0A1Y0CIS6_9BACI|nr:hypothetical protein [Sutcliffiella horikoshii]ART75180.1 hypothetical protein B4U37_03585 [Sutcliffiella horikoshii]TYS58556.1 hypothetical protein FZC74_12180 [Sutcliffiella horikoshii]
MKEWIATITIPQLLIGSILLLGLAIILNIVIYRKYRNQPKVDKGMALVYHKLSTRRKLIRNLWMAPIFLGLLLLVMYLTDQMDPFGFFVFGVVTTIGIVDCIRLYRRWQQEKREAH